MNAFGTLDFVFDKPRETRGNLLIQFKVMSNSFQFEQHVRSEIVLVQIDYLIMLIHIFEVIKRTKKPIILENVPWNWDDAFVFLHH